MTTISVPATGHRSRQHRLIADVLRRPAAVASIGFLALLVVVAMFAPLVAPKDPNAQVLADNFQGPGWSHLLGTDDLGRDVLSRLVFATRISVTAPLIALSVSLLIGVPTGLLAGYRKGLVDWALSRLADTALAVPAIIMALAIVAVLGPSLVNAMISVGLVYAPRLFRVVRASTLATREELFIESARSIGCSTVRTLRSHVLPNIASPVIVQATLMMGFALLAEASLSFLGLGVQPPNASWGTMLRAAYDNRFRAPYAAVPSGLALTMAVLAFNSLGDTIRDVVTASRQR